MNELTRIAAAFLIVVHLAACKGVGKTEQPERTISAHGNHLVGSLSPYLLQHADNPVDWYPWGDEAITKARLEDKPIFLSIGYSACHWCHVMERESFEDEAIAAFLNEHFVSIKVDREEHPEIDEIYMNAVQMMTGSGGWPLTVFLTPDLKPFFGGTYFPPESMYGRMGFRQLLEKIVSVYGEEREKVDVTAEQVMQGLRGMNVSQPGRNDFDRSVVDAAFQSIGSSFDAVWGGFGPDPKFPPTGQIDILLRNYRRTGNPDALKMVEETLSGMANGGIFDHLGGGFHRYSTDNEWLTPHFEKMLYDNALLAVTYLDCYKVTGDEFYADIARRTLDWIVRDMSDPAGGFHSSWDADSEGEEGRFYVWDSQEIQRILGDDDFRTFSQAYGITTAGNFEGANILRLPRLRPKDRAENISKTDRHRQLASMREKLLTARGGRVHPHRDDKVLTDWNGLAICALASGYRVLGDESYLAAASRAADFFRDRMWRDGVLLHSYRSGNSDIEGMVDDYAFQMAGMVELYQASFDEKYLDEAVRLADSMADLFWDDEGGGYFTTAAGRKDLIDRTKSGRDGAIPSGNSVAAAALLALYQFVDNSDYRDRAENIVRTFVPWIERYPTGHLRLVGVIDNLTAPLSQVAIIGAREALETQAMLAAVNGEYMPGAILAFAVDRADTKVAIFEGRETTNGKSTAYFCRDFTCEAPVTSAEELKNLIENAH